MAVHAKRPSEIFAEQLRAWRKRRGWSAQQLADRIAERHGGEHGGELDRSAIAKIEAGTRGVSLDEWLLLAAALAVPPPLLFLPLGSGEPVAVTPRSELHPDLAWQWIEGESPLATTERLAMDIRLWHEAAEPVRMYRSLRDRQNDYGSAWARLRSAEYVGDEEAIRTAKRDHADAMTALHEHLTGMLEAGVEPPGQSPETLLDMKRFGLNVEHLSVYEPDEQEAPDGEHS